MTQVSILWLVLIHRAIVKGNPWPSMFTYQFITQNRDAHRAVGQYACPSFMSEGQLDAASGKKRHFGSCNRTAASMLRWPGAQADRSLHRDLLNKSDSLKTQTQLRDKLIWWTFSWFMVRIQWNTRSPDTFIEILLNHYHLLVPSESSYLKNVTYNLPRSIFQWYFNF